MFALRHCWFISLRFTRFTRRCLRDKKPELFRVPKAGKVKQHGQNNAQRLITTFSLSEPHVEANTAWQAHGNPDTQHLYKLLQPHRRLASYNSAQKCLVNVSFPCEIVLSIHQCSAEPWMME